MQQNDSLARGFITCTVSRPVRRATSPKAPPIGHAPKPISETSGPSRVHSGCCESAAVPSPDPF